MDLQALLRARRSVKQFEAGHPMSDEEVRALVESLALTPSSYNMQNWHFVVVRDQAIKDQLHAASWNQAQVRDASAVFVFGGDLQAWREPEGYLRNLPEESRAGLTGMIRKFYSASESLQRDEACRSAGLSAMTLMLCAKDMGYDTCPMIGFDPVKVSEIVGLPAHLPPVMMVVVGKAKHPARPRMGLKRIEEFVSIDRYGRHEIKGAIDEA